MKKLLCFFLIFATIFTFAACDKGPSAEDIEFELQGLWEAKSEDVRIKLGFQDGYSSIYGEQGKKDGKGSGTYKIDSENDLIKIDFEYLDDIDYFDGNVLYKYNKKTGEIRYYVTIYGLPVKLERISTAH